MVPITDRLNATLRKIAEPELQDKITDEKLKEAFNQVYGENVVVRHMMLGLKQAGATGVRMLLVSDAPGALLRALSALPGSQVEALSVNQYLAITTHDAIDLIVFEGLPPGGALPDVPALVVNPGPGQDPSAGFIPLPEPTRLRAQDPILNGVDLAGVTFGQVPVTTLGPDDVRSQYVYPFPTDPEKQAELRFLGYRNMLEQVADRLLQYLR